jgi:hypothetical protein
MVPSALRIVARVSIPVVALVFGELAVAGGGDLKPAAPTTGQRAALAARAAHDHFDRVVFDEPGDGTIWARGASYKASFGKSGVTLVPFLGASAPSSHPLTLRPGALSRGGVTIGFDREATAQRSGDAIAIDRGSFVERYALDPFAIEQTFVLEHAAGSGDFMMRVDALTDLARSEDADALRFENELGGVVYGKATVVDARGARLALATHVVGGAIEIVVPASFLDTARYPVTIDPVISTFAIDTTTTTDDFAPDVAYDASTNRYMACYEEAFSALDHDVYEELLDSAGNFFGGGYVDITTDDWRHPRIANNATASQFMAVAHVGAAPARQIFSRVVSSGNVFGSVHAVAPTFSDTDQVDPDIGGDPALSGGDSYLVAWEFLTPSTGERDIVQMLMHTNGLPDGGTAICIECNTSPNVNPAVSKWCGVGNGHDHVWNVVWEYPFSPSDHDIYGAQLYYSLQFAGPFAIDASTLDDRRPTVSSFAEGTAAPGNYLVAFDRFFPSDHDIIGYAMNGASVVANASLSFLEGPTYYYQDQIAPSADSDGCAFAVAYSEQYSTSTTDYDVYVSTFNVVGSSIEALETHQNLAFSSLPELDAQITAAPGAPSMNYLTAWTRQAAGNSDVYGGLYKSATIVPFCFAGIAGVAPCPCGNPAAGGGGCDNSHATGGATLSAAGSASISSDTLGFVQSGELQNSLSIFLQGTSDIFSGAVFGGGVRCVGGTLKRLYSHAASGGTVSAPVGGDSPVTTRSAALGDTIGPCSTRFYQAYYRDPNLGFCAAGFNVGNGIKVLWLP